MKDYILYPNDPIEKFSLSGGGKAANLARLSQANVNVPPWICVSTEVFKLFVEENNLKAKLSPTNNLKEFAHSVEELFLKSPISEKLQELIINEIDKNGLAGEFLALRSSGMDEDSPAFSFAGQFSSFLYQKGPDAIFDSLRKCWASAFSERCLSYRFSNNLPVDSINIAVVIQKMVNADSAGVAFSRDPVNLLKRDQVVISSVWGLGEGLVSGALDADHFSINRLTFEVDSKIISKPEAFKQSPQGGLERVDIKKEQQEAPSLSSGQVIKITQLATQLEEKFGQPQDCEWAFENGELYCVQTRPITNLPPPEFYDGNINGNRATLWDNSNIVESYSGVTSPLTFSFASYAYRQVYLQFCEVIGVPKETINRYDPVFRNMLGLIRGHVYYNLINWYKLVVLLPGAASNKEFMETMMGVKQHLGDDTASLFEFTENIPKYSLGHKLNLYGVSAWRFLCINTIVKNFQEQFDKIYTEARKTDFTKLSLQELAEYYQYLEEKVLKNWQAPIINDTLCMVSFGLLKKLTEKWVQAEENITSLQNDLLCGEGDIESTEPTKMLMRIAEVIDNGDPTFREWFCNNKPEVVWYALSKKGKSEEISTLIQKFLDKYGFRCINELKLEENDLHDDPTFAVNAISNYVRMKSYSIGDMEEREQAIRKNAEDIVFSKLSSIKRPLFKWVLKYARKAIRYRENLRFARTKIFGIIRHLFRAIGEHLAKLGTIEFPRDIFYLTVDEIMAFIEGRPVSTDLKALIAMRKREFEEYRQSPPPPDRFITFGAAGISMQNPQIIDNGNLEPLKDRVSDDPCILLGTPCCPGVVEGVVRVVKSFEDARDLNGEILVTERTDPGWVPLYPSCSGLLIERGSLLSHSAVVARELGLPTIVGITGGLTRKLSTGDRVRIDAGKGEVKIL